MSPYAQSVYNIFKASQNSVTSEFVTSYQRRQHSDYFQYWDFTEAKIGSELFSEPFKDFYNNKGLTPSQWYSTYANVYNADSWKAIL